MKDTACGNATATNRNKERTKDQRSEAHARYYQKYKQRILARMRERRVEINRVRRERYARDPEYRTACRERNLRWAASDPEKAKAMRKEIRRRYRISARGKEMESRWKKKYLAENRERLNARRRQLMRDPERKAKRAVALKAYYKEHREELNAKRRDSYNKARHSCASSPVGPNARNPNARLLGHFTNPNPNYR